MDAGVLGTRVKARANEVVQDEIKKFRRAVWSAITELLERTGCERSYGDPLGMGDWPENHTEFLTVLVRGGGIRVWPPRLWTGAEQKLLNEILGTMDVVQRMVAARGPASDDVIPGPVEPPVEGGAQ